VPPPEITDQHDLRVAQRAAETRALRPIGSGQKLRAEPALRAARSKTVLGVGVVASSALKRAAGQHDARDVGVEETVRRGCASRRKERNRSDPQIRRALLDEGTDEAAVGRCFLIERNQSRPSARKGVYESASAP